MRTSSAASLTLGSIFRSKREADLTSMSASARSCPSSMRTPQTVVQPVATVVAMAEAEEEASEVVAVAAMVEDLGATEVAEEATEAAEGVKAEATAVAVVAEVATVVAAAAVITTAVATVAVVVAGLVVVTHGPFSLLPLASATSKEVETTVSSICQGPSTNRIETSTRPIPRPIPQSMASSQERCEPATRGSTLRRRTILAITTECTIATAACSTESKT